MELRTKFELLLYKNIHAVLAFLIPNKIQKRKVKTISNDEAIELIRRANLVDAEFYLNTYEDVKRRGVEPVSHYVRYGYKEGRNPNKFFDTSFYRNFYKLDVELNPLIDYLLCEENYLNKTSELFDGQLYYFLNADVMSAKVNPLQHYLTYGKDERRKFTLSRSVTANQSPLQVKKLTSIPCKLSSKKLTILIPVYNALEEVLECIDSVIVNTPLGESINVVILNDCSPDPRVKQYLNKYVNIKGLTIIHNEENIGYTGNVNKGVEISNTDVILLNSDTIVTPNWYKNLLIAAYSDDRIGTVTAVSNNAGAFSVPYIGTNDIDESIGIFGTSRLVSSINEIETIETPTGNGFCLFIKRDLLEDIGDFDIVNYPRGYGEENDFCMRALNNGWVNIIDPKTYVYHKRSASFKESKEKLIVEGVAKVKETHPNYDGAIKSISQSNSFKKLRKEVELKLNTVKPNDSILKPKIMFVISTRTGGTPKTNMDLMNGLKDIYDCYALACNSELVEILRAEPKGYKQIEAIKLDKKVKFATHRSFEYERVVKSLLIKYNIDLLHIRHIAWHSLVLPSIAKDLYIPVVKSFHDFYAICPSVNLLDAKGSFCPKGVTNENPNLLWNDETVTDIDDSYLKMWQKRMSSALSPCDYFITTSHSAKDLIEENLEPVGFRSNSFEVIPHGRNFDSFDKPKFNKYPKSKIKVLLPGNITISKGRDLVVEIKSLDKDNRIEFHVLGTCDDTLKPLVNYHGSYSREDFQKKVVDISPDIAAVLSVWPETYCHTLTESWASGVPVLGLSYGAVEERILQHGGGWLVENDPKQCYEKLIGLLDNKASFIKAHDDILAWQKGFGLTNTVERMTGQYLSIYQTLLSKEQDTLAPVKRKLGFVLKGIYPNVPPTAYVRLVDWKDSFEQETGLNVEFVSWQTLITGDIQRFKEFVIQRDAIPDYAVDWCLNSLAKNNIEYTYEIDDNLLDVPLSVDPDGVYQSYKPYLIKLLKNAFSVHVTNNELANVCKQYNENIVIRPNRTFPQRWSMDFPKEEKISLKLPNKSINILYFGSRTHQEDLEFLLEVLEQANKAGERYHLSIVGCGDIKEKLKDFVTRLTPPSSRYDIFVDWLTKISHNFDIGVAPLVDEKFAKTKSYLKCLEFAQLNLPVICSDVMPYIELKSLDQCKDIVFVPNNIESWVGALKEK